MKVIVVTPDGFDIALKNWKKELPDVMADLFGDEAPVAQRDERREDGTRTEDVGVPVLQEPGHKRDAPHRKGSSKRVSSPDRKRKR
jgi:hypothetical protein